MLLLTLCQVNVEVKLVPVNTMMFIFKKVILCYRYVLFKAGELSSDV